ncbi:uncharacterized protein LOC117102037 [Anneissia japonica]|uniref:uncharacterized protein LOC117102037 n=1 Tax=Anneissia japonica TaxID=1529436 RepID=UPI00142595FF|nr:uncharacterized protein LOC117102037 [Anneissia japonica]
MTTRKKPPVKPRPTRNSRIKSEGNEQDYRNENISYPGYDCEGKYEPPDSNYTQVQKKRDNQNIGVNREDLPVRLPEPFKKQTNVTREATTTDSKTRPVRHDPRPKSMPNAKTELIADLNKVLKGREISTEENRKNLQIPSLQRSQEIGLHVKFNERKHPSQQSDVIEKYTPEQSGVFGKYTPEQSQKHTREQPHVFEKHPSKQSDVFEKYTPDQPDVFGKKYTPEQSEKHTLGQSEVSEKHPSEQSDVFEKYTPDQPDVLIKKYTPEQSEKHNLGQPQVSEKHPSEQSDVLEKYTPEQPDDFRKYTPEQFEKPTRGQCQVFEKHPSEQSDVFEKHPLEQPGFFRKYTPGQHNVFEKHTPARSDDFEKHIRWQTQVFEKHPPEQSDVFEKHPPEKPAIPIKQLAHGVHTMEPITHYQRQQAQKTFAKTEGQQTEDNLTEFSKECRYFLDHVKWLHENVKETREKYENDEMLRVVLYTKEQKMFWHLGDIEYALNSFTGHLEKVMEDYVKIVKLVNEWLKENYFEAFENYYLNSDIQQSLVSHVKENRPIFHQVLQEKHSQTQQLNRNYSFEDLEARFEEPKKWYHILNYHLRRLDEAHTRCFNVTMEFKVIQFETMKLLEEKQTNIIEKKKQHADHPWTIITALEVIIAL